LPEKEELEGQSLLPLVVDPVRRWNEAVVSSVGRGSHSVFTKPWRYIHYFDGSEELYNLQEDPEEWTNLAGNPLHEEVKQNLSVYIPVDNNYRQFVRWGKWKAAIRSDGDMELYDIHETFGVSEHNNVAGTNPEIVEAISKYLIENRIEQRHVLIPE
jgi:hypothetical protein